MPTPFVVKQISQIDYMPLLDTDGNYLIYDLLMNKFGLNKCNKDFTLFIKLIAKLPESWDDKENNRVSQTPQNQQIYEKLKATVETLNGTKAYTSLFNDRFQRVLRINNALEGKIS